MKDLRPDLCPNTKKMTMYSEWASVGEILKLGHIGYKSRSLGVNLG